MITKNYKCIYTDTNTYTQTLTDRVCVLYTDSESTVYYDL